MNYTIFLTNFGYFLQDSFDTLEAAIAKAKATSFECTIHCDGRPVYFQGPFGSRSI